MNTLTELFAQDDSWCQGAEAKVPFEVDGQTHLLPVNSPCNIACQWCLVGAVRQITNCKHQRADLLDGIAERIASIPLYHERVDDQPVPKYEGVKVDELEAWISVFNDHKDTRLTDIRAVVMPVEDIPHEEAA